MRTKRALTDGAYKYIRKQDPKPDADLDGNFCPDPDDICEATTTSEEFYFLNGLDEVDDLLDGDVTMTPEQINMLEYLRDLMMLSPDYNL